MPKYPHTQGNLKVTGRSIYDGDTCIAVMDYNGRALDAAQRGREMYGNAILFATAWKLLAALESIIPVAEKVVAPDHPNLVKCRAICAEAKGEPPPSPVNRETVSQKGLFDQEE